MKRTPHASTQKHNKQETRPVSQRNKLTAPEKTANQEDTSLQKTGKYRRYINQHFLLIRMWNISANKPSTSPESLEYWTDKSHRF